MVCVGLSSGSALIPLHPLLLDAGCATIFRLRPAALRGASSDAFPGEEDRTVTLF